MELGSDYLEAALDRYLFFQITSAGIRSDLLVRWNWVLIALKHVG
jgi:hypothetical protein